MAEVITKPAEKQSQAHHKTTIPAGDPVEKLSKFGGFTFLESSVNGIQNLNPERKARKQIFLTDDSKSAERQALKNTLDLWIDLLSTSESITQMLDKCKEKSEFVTERLAQNQLTAVNAVKNLERSYRNVMLFFKNTETEKVTNLTIVNASKEQITDLDNSRFIDYIAAELKQNYDRLDLRTNYSLLALPGYLGSNKVLDKWARIAYDNKVHLFTDFADLDQPDDVVEMFFDANHTSADAYKSNVIMACNWLVGRRKYKEIGETEDLHTSPSIALMGKVYMTQMAQVAAGKKYGGLNEVEEVAFQLKKSELSQLERMGLVPVVNEYGKVMAFSAKTLFNGDNLGLQTYSVVRVFDYLTKVLFDFLNRRAFENWNIKTEKDLRKQIVSFLDTVQGPDRLIKEFKLLRLEQDKDNKDRVHLNLYLTPYFPGKSFIIQLDGTKGQDYVDWAAEYQQQ
ncbi:MAG: DUF5458 family protein [Rikenellaceae bacterium]|nr:DUF5458 family protein [Rikenellaceae bacterium]